MDLRNLRDTYPLLLSYMETKSYSKQYIQYIEKDILWIINESSHYAWLSYDDIYQTYVDKWSNKTTLNHKKRRLLVIERFDLESKMPNGLKHAHKSSAYDSLSAEFKDFIDTYRNLEGLGYSKKYLKSTSYMVCSFLLDLQNKGINSFKSVTEESVLDVFSSDGKICRSYNFKYTVEFAFKTCLPFYGDGICSRMLSYLPALPHVKKNVQYLTKEEMWRIKSVLEKDTTLSLQNKAICLLALYTGMRSSDICSLTFKSIDWDNDLIRIKQQKTDAALVLPLCAVVGNAIFDYITKERPKSSADTIFLTVNAPYRRLHSSNLNAICVSIMEKAGIRQNPGDRKGMHLFRHYLATSLLGYGVEQPIISSTLGHQSPSSLAPYLSADFTHLKECALNIERFPVRKEVFQP
ncbi:tyrosine-type recombinase/integrase [Parabacteroides bouchesdurhonensis]|uniref:tyrosine-type recombinase/integrase n=1 Tax=Parabacteroides bouchesdurhonensis TaxID=1936995 RepID=UPI000C84E43B|nr:tyrosine-type recombinase/integrase [Parabacteroides bouchesdurhonensis]